MSDALTYWPADRLGDPYWAAAREL